MDGAFSSAFFDEGYWETAITTTGVVTPRWAIQMELSGVGNGWTTVTSDVRAEDNVVLNYGIQGVTATDRCATTGTLEFTLNNGPTNSAQTIGYYSPDNVNCRPGFNFGIRVRLALTYRPVGTVYKFLGSLDSVKPTAGVRGRYLSKCLCVDWLDEAARYHVSGLSLQLNQRGDQVFQTVVSSMPIQPAAIQTSTGLDTYPYSLDDVQDETTTSLQIFQDLALSELGLIYVKGDAMQGGTLVYESRSIRGANRTAVQTFSNTMETVEIERSRQNLLNKVQVTAHPRKVDATNNTVLFTLNTASLIQPGTSLDLNAPFRDPTQPLARVGGTNLVPPVATTDYTANSAADGSGVDLTSSITVTIDDSSGNSADLTIANVGHAQAYITKLNLRGQGIYDYNTTISTNENTVSQLNLGQRVLNLDMAYQADPLVANEASQYILNVWSNPLSYITKLTIVGNWSDALMQAVMLRDISDCIALDETITGLADTVRYFINAVSLSITQGRVARATYTLVPADQNSYWYLEVVGSSELDQTTRPGYGLIVGHTDVAHTDTHGDVAHADLVHQDAHTDVTHGDTAHADSTHNDVVHSDTVHGDSSHFDSHDDTTHADSAHTDVAHTDSHGDIAHADSHGDTTHVDLHDDIAHNDQAHQDDSHFDTDFFPPYRNTHDDSAHGDVAHADDHTDVSHADTHNDTAHSDATNNTAHQDVAHTDTAHVDDHSDVNHVDSAHVDVAHADDNVHGDTAHVDSAFDDLHADVLHSDSAHTDTHADTQHGDAG